MVVLSCCCDIVLFYGCAVEMSCFTVVVLLYCCVVILCYFMVVLSQEMQVREF